MNASHIDFDMPLPPAAWHGTYQVQCGADGTLELGSSFGMALRAGLHRLFRIGKTSADTARNQASWRALIAAVERRGGAAVRERLCRASLALPGDRVPGLTVADRIERGTYLSHAALQQVFVLFRRAVSVDRANQRIYAELLTPAATSSSATPLYAMLDGISLGLNETTDAGAPCPFPATRAYVAEQLKLGLQAQTARARRRDPAMLKSALASCAPRTGRPEQRRGLRSMAARIRSPPALRTDPAPGDESRRTQGLRPGSRGSGTAGRTAARGTDARPEAERSPPRPGTVAAGARGRERGRGSAPARHRSAGCVQRRQRQRRRRRWRRHAVRAAGLAHQAARRAEGARTVRRAAPLRWRAGIEPAEPGHAAHALADAAPRPGARAAGRRPGGAEAARPDPRRPRQGLVPGRTPASRSPYRARRTHGRVGTVAHRRGEAVGPGLSAAVSRRPQPAIPA
ncbi:hypothetical protein OJJOAM_001031 [Cupriavidus sp. H18C1]